jgi:hypothetical protein
VSAAGSRHMGRVAKLGCVICRLNGFEDTPPHVHHIREGQGTAQRADDFLTIPLCPEHHQGKTGIHGMGVRAFERMYKTTELDLLAYTLEQLYGH